jgi:hypothetical protein
MAASPAPLRTTMRSPWTSTSGAIRPPPCAPVPRYRR